MKKISVVIPVYCEEDNLRPFLGRLEEIAHVAADLEWEFIFVNDGSSDDSITVLRQMASEDDKVKIVDLSKNFGKEAALTAGLQFCSGDATICLDADLQHPPELIPQLIEAWNLGAEVVATVRTGTDEEPLMRRLGSRGYYWLMGKITHLDMVSQTTDFRLLDKKVVDAYLSLTERERMFRAIVDWVGFKKVYVEFHASARNQGRPTYSYSKLRQLAINSVVSFSLWPLRITGYLGLVISSVSGLLLIVMLGNHLFSSKHFFTTLGIVVVFNTLLIGTVLMSIGLVALYIGAIHAEVINRPLFIVRESLNFDEPRSKGQS
jgi:glycosyltransferase involved in cell wall biosynthesis